MVRQSSQGSCFSHFTNTSPPLLRRASRSPNLQHSHCTLALQPVPESLPVADHGAAAAAKAKAKVGDGTHIELSIFSDIIST